MGKKSALAQQLDRGTRYVAGGFAFLWVIAVFLIQNTGGLTPNSSTKDLVIFSLVGPFVSLIGVLLFSLMTRSGDKEAAKEREKNEEKKQKLARLTEAMEKAAVAEDLPSSIAILMDAGFSVGSGQIGSLLPEFFWSVYPELVAKILGTLTAYYRRTYSSRLNDLLSYFVEGIRQLPSYGANRYDQVYLTILFSQAVSGTTGLDEVVKRKRLHSQMKSR